MISPYQHSFTNYDSALTRRGQSENCPGTSVSATEQTPVDTLQKQVITENASMQAGKQKTNLSGYEQAIADLVLFNPAIKRHVINITENHSNNYSFLINKDSYPPMSGVDLPGWMPSEVKADCYVDMKWNLERAIIRDNTPGGVNKVYCDVSFELSEAVKPLAVATTHQIGQQFLIKDNDDNLRSNLQIIRSLSEARLEASVSQVQAVRSMLSRTGTQQKAIRSINRRPTTASDDDIRALAFNDAGKPRSRDNVLKILHESGKGADSKRVMTILRDERAKKLPSEKPEGMRDPAAVTSRAVFGQ